MKYYGRNDNDYTKLVLKSAIAGSKQYWVLETAPHPHQIVATVLNVFVDPIHNFQYNKAQYKRYRCPTHDV